MLPDILVQFRKSYPDVHMKLLTGDSDSAIQKVLSEDADFAVAALPDNTPEKLFFKKITDMHLKFVAPTIKGKIKQYEALVLASAFYYGTFYYITFYYGTFYYSNGAIVSNPAVIAG